MQKRLLDYLIDVVTGDRCGFLDRIVLFVLSFLEIIYFSAVAVRNIFYRYDIFSQDELSTRVISVGNITAGGTGKTPAVEKLARMIKGCGKKPVIISRGYKGEADSPLVVADEEGVKVSRVMAGDEAFMLASHLSGVPVVAGKNRYRAGHMAEKLFSPDIIILDDGFQHRQLDRDVDFLTVDVTRPFGYNHLLPRGFLREPLSAFGRASAVILTRTDHLSNRELEDISKRIRNYNSGLRIFSSCHSSRCLRSVAGGGDGEIPVKFLCGKKILVFSGIGNPDAFAAQLTELGAEIVDSFFYSDHFEYQREDLMELAVQGETGEAEFAVTTEKDAVKFTPEMLDEFAKLGFPLYTLQIELEIMENVDSLMNIVLHGSPGNEAD